MLESAKLSLLGKLLIFVGLISMVSAYWVWKDSRITKQTPTTIASMQSRGYMKCGVASNMPGLSVVNRNSIITKTDSLIPADRKLKLYSDSTGLEADMCRAVAIGLFGTSVNTLYYHIEDGSWDAKMNSVVAGTIDLLIRQVAIQSELGSSHEVDFSAVVYFDRIVLLTNSRIHSAEDPQLNGKKICVINNSKTAGVTLAYSKKLNNGWKVISSSAEGPIESAVQAVRSLLSRDCFGVVNRFSILYSALVKNPEYGDYQLLDLIDTPSIATVGVVASSAYQFKGLVNHSIWTLMRAEATGQSSEKVSPGYNANFWLGKKLNSDHPRRIIQQVGNYNEIYKIHFGDAMPETGPNSHYSVSTSGRLIAPR